VADLADEGARDHAPETVLSYSAERPLLSAMEAERAVCRMKCSVVRA
jgi:hypothetical protein